MLATRRDVTLTQGVLTFFEVLYHTIVRNVRNESGGAALGIALTIFRSVMMVAIFVAIFQFMGMGGVKIRGDVVLFMYTGVSLFLLHNSAITRTMSAGNPLLPILRHTSMTTVLNILAANCALLYTHVISSAAILAYVHLWRDALDIAEPEGLIAPYLLAWGSGIAIGMILLAIKPFLPRVAEFASLIYRRLNMVSSGKFVVANMLPATFTVFFTWNPLFHCIDQLRGAVFVNYFPHKTGLGYPLAFVGAAMVIGMMAEFWLRRNLSASTQKRQ
jgi:ABC-type polysaccharide/polyol phosphate export permease